MRNVMSCSWSNKVGDHGYCSYLYHMYSFLCRPVKRISLCIFIFTNKNSDRLFQRTQMLGICTA
ncbi:unnamed protein product [Amoebophrya sp. A120]|nr:unnamed protein product [Amoebophrya sp. A120]|eukprot:GSA120T00013569001.1